MRRPYSTVRLLYAGLYHERGGDPGVRKGIFKRRIKNAFRACRYSYENIINAVEKTMKKAGHLICHVSPKNKRGQGYPAGCDVSYRVADIQALSLLAAVPLIVHACKQSPLLPFILVIDI